MKGLPIVVATLLMLLVMPRVVRAEADAGVVAGDAGDEAGDSGTPSRDGGPEAVDGGRPRHRPEARPIPPELLPRVEAQLGVEQVELGQVIPMTITVHHSPGARVHLRQLRELGPFELLGSSQHEAPTSGEEGPTQVMELQLISFEVGELEVPAVELMVVLSDGRTGSVTTPVLSVRVTDPLANENDPQPRADHAPRPVMTTDKRALWVGGFVGALLLAILLGMAIGKLRARRRPKPAPPPPPPRPPEDVALEKLEAAEKSGWLEEGEVKTFHVAVSEAVREYLGGRYGFDSLELTTEELLGQLAGVTIRGVTRHEIEAFLFDTDLVKFAKWRPDLTRSSALLDDAYRIVRETTRAEQLQPRSATIEAKGAAKVETETQREDVAERGGQSEPDAPLERDEQPDEGETSKPRDGREAGGSDEA